MKNVRQQRRKDIYKYILVGDEDDEGMRVYMGLRVERYDN